MEGKVDSQNYGSPEWLQVKLNDIFCPGDKIRAGDQSRSTLRLKNESVITLDQNTTISFSEPEVDKVTWFINLLQGSTFFRSRHPQHLNVHTPYVNAVHEGTEFLVTVDNSKTSIAVFDGLVSAQNKQGKISIGKGQNGIAPAQGIPEVHALNISPTDAVQWALYYPPIFDSQGQSSKLNAINQAATALNAGRADIAGIIIDSIRRNDPGNSDALALQAIIAVTKNQQNQALQLAKDAIQKNPQSAGAQVALSYALQASLKIEDALAAVQEAVKLSPNNSLAWARLAELQLSTGKHDAALVSAQKAQGLNPHSSKSQTVMGFAMLASSQIDEAEQAFLQAISLDSADPLPRLGLGLAKIHNGNIEGGKTEMETAVNLDPNSSVIRSYLGKTHYELKNQDYAGTEYQLAKELDSKDPTPWFYDAILKQTINRPVEALQDMQKAIGLNGNRGVYRSQLLLENDSAARSASLARIYNDLGFQQRGLLEGWQAVNTDPSNYSAHRLLSDNYAALPRHEIARVSELLKAQLLQPINLTPVQPQTAESNILLLNGLGSSITSFNEYNPLFSRDQLALQASGYVDGNNTKSDELVHSGVWKNISYSLGQFHYDTDGERPNNDQKKDAYNVFVQSQISTNTNAQFEYRRTEHQYGDITQGFFTNRYSLFDNHQKLTDTFRGGLHHAWSERSDTLISVVHKDETSKTSEASQGLHFDTGDTNNGTQYEMQQMLRFNKFDLTAGMNYLLSHQGEQTFSIDLPDHLFHFTSETDHKAFYLYSNIKVIPKLLATVGFSQDFLQQNNSLSAPFFDFFTPTIGRATGQKPS
ncbi:hypothetical protein JCM14076_27280 [Methylosoma difficile]